MNDIWAAGGTMAAHWNGSAWSKTSLTRLLPRPSLLCPAPPADHVFARSSRDVRVAGAGNCQDARGPFVLLHYNGMQRRRMALLTQSGEPRQLVPDGSGGLWIATVAGFPRDVTMLHYSGGQLHAATMPLPPSRLRVDGLAHVPFTTVTFGAGTALPPAGGFRLSAIILRIDR